MFTQRTILVDYVCLLFYIFENEVVVLVKILQDSILAIKNTLTGDLFVFEENSEKNSI